MLLHAIESRLWTIQKSSSDSIDDTTVASDREKTIPGDRKAARASAARLFLLEANTAQDASTARATEGKGHLYTTARTQVRNTLLQRERI